MSKRSLLPYVINVAGAAQHFDILSKKLPILALKYKVQFCVYDGPNLCSWNGGRINRDIKLTYDMIDTYNRRGIQVALTFTNPTIDLSDKIGWKLVTSLLYCSQNNDIKNKIILVNEELRKLLSKLDLELIYSVTGHPSSLFLDVDYYKDLESKYDFIVPKFEHVFNDRFIDECNPEKYEIMTNDTCKYGCIHYKEHFDAIAKQNLNRDPWRILGKDYCTQIEECWLPRFNPDTGCEKDKKKYGKNLGMDLDFDAVKMALGVGYKSFKISGRENSPNIIISQTEQLLKDIHEKRDTRVQLQT